MARKLLWFAVLLAALASPRLEAQSPPQRALKISYYEPDTALKILRHLHRQSIGAEPTLKGFTREEAQARYLTSLSTVLIAFQRMTPDAQTVLFDAILRDVQARSSFEGVQSLFATTLMAMHGPSQAQLAKAGSSLWLDVGPPAVSDGNLGSVFVIDRRTGSLVMLPRLPDGPNLAKALDKISVRANQWFNEQARPELEAKFGRSIAPLTKWRDGSGEGDAVERAINSMRQTALRHFESLIPGPPESVADYVGVIVSPLWIFSAGTVIAVGGVALPTLAEGAWLDMKFNPTLIITVGSEGRVSSLYNGPARQDPPGDGQRRAGLNEAPNAGDAKESSSGRNGGGGRGGGSNSSAGRRPSGQGSTPSSGSTPRNGGGEGHRGGGAGSSNGGQDNGKSEAPPDTNEPSKSKAPPEGRATEDGSNASVKSYSSQEAYERGEPPYFEELPGTEPRGQTRRDDDVGPRGLKRSRWSAEMTYRMVYGELWFTRHPNGLKLLEKRTGADDNDRPKLPDPSQGQSARDRNGDLKDLPGRLTSTGGTIPGLEVRLPIPEDFRPMPTKN